MGLVVADTGPLRYLILIEETEILARLYERLIVPSSVFIELTHQRAPQEVRRWAESLPRWAEVKTAGNVPLKDILDTGEAEAIALCQELAATALLIDEAEAREIALARGLPVTGTIGIIEKAAQLNLLDLKSTFERLLKTNFRISPQLVKDALSRQGTQSKKP
jgi:predicted nucleic acid-binding protein